MDVTVDFVCTLRAQSNHPPLIFDARGNGGGGISLRQLREIIKTG